MKMSRREWMGTVGLTMVFVIGWLVVSTVILVNRQILDEDTYTSALVSNDAYERTYTEVLADPQLAELQEQLLGRLRLGSLVAPQARTLATNALHWAVPPSTLQAGTEVLIHNILKYVRGDTDHLDSDVVVQNVLDNIDSTAVVEARTSLAGSADRAADNLDDLGAAVRRFAAQLAAGTVPDSIPMINSASIDVDAIADTVLEALGPIVNDKIRAQVLAAVTAGDQRDALITAAGDLVAVYAENSADELRAAAKAGREFDVAAAIAIHARQPAAEVVGSLNTARDVASWFRPLMAIVGVLLMAGAGFGLLRIHRASLHRALLVLSAALVLAGVVQLAAWLLAARYVPTPFDEATSTGASSWQLPTGLRTLLADIQSTLVGDVSRAAAWLSLVMIVPGVVLGVIAMTTTIRTTRVALAITGLIAIAVAIGATLVSTTEASAASERQCNGHAELCDRKYNDVVYAATHNSMSSPGVVNVWPEHDGNLRQQLDAGVRALLIDTHYWPPVNSPTDLINVQQAIDAAEPRLPRSVANAVYPTLGDLRDGRDGSFLCHINCAFGAMPFLDGMVAVREFLDANPDEVVTLIIQDAISTPDTESVMHEAGLDPYLYQHRGDHTWPTLGEIIDRGQRLVVFAEVAGPPPPWYANAFEEMQETPYLFTSPEEFSCDRNRGGDTAPLFLMNHWVQRIAPDRVDATVVNIGDVLVDRARECERERGLEVNYVAVNFYNIGDLMAAVDELNGV